MQIERLVQMVFLIVNRGQVTARQLASYLNVSTRTIYKNERYPNSARTF